jgi:hypothetical protein
VLAALAIVLAWAAAEPTLDVRALTIAEPSESAPFDRNVLRGDPAPHLVVARRE